MSVRAAVGRPVSQSTSPVSWQTFWLVPMLVGAGGGASAALAGGKASNNKLAARRIDLAWHIVRSPRLLRSVWVVHYGDFASNTAPRINNQTPSPIPDKCDGGHNISLRLAGIHDSRRL